MFYKDIKYIFYVHPVRLLPLRLVSMFFCFILFIFSTTLNVKNEQPLLWSFARCVYLFILLKYILQIYT